MTTNQTKKSRTIETLKVMAEDVKRIPGKALHAGETTLVSIWRCAGSSMLAWPTAIRRYRETGQSGYFAGPGISSLFSAAVLGPLAAGWPKEAAYTAEAIVAANIVSGVYEWVRSANYRARAGGLEEKTDTSIAPSVGPQ